MTDFEEVEITPEIAEPGYCYVRPFGSDDSIKVALSRLVDEATARSRTHVETITTNHNDWINGSWISTTTTKTVIA
jgi:hypothetical protein